MLILQNISYTLPNRDLLFSDISLSLNPQDKIGLIGKNGVGKSTLLKIITGELSPSHGNLHLETAPYYLPQIFGQFDHLKVSEALGIEEKLQAFTAILDGKGSEENYASLDEDWTIEERCQAALAYWKLGELKWDRKLGSLSGGQKTRVFLAAISIHEPPCVLMDEPSNHLDTAGRELLYQFILKSRSSLFIVSHDRKLLNHLEMICEMQKDGIRTYGGNYDFYREQIEIERKALNQDLQNKELSLRKAKKKQKETKERQQKLDSRGRKKHKKSGTPRVMMNKLKNDAEHTSSKLKNQHSKKVDSISQELREIRASLPEIDKMKFGFEDSSLHKGKTLCKAEGINYSYGGEVIWQENLNFYINSGQRLALKGSNGSGKTTLIRLILGELSPQRGILKRAMDHAVYIDQDYSLLNNSLKLYEQAQSFNNAHLQEHEIKIRLSRFLFGKGDWDKSCAALSGGERMRLSLCCLTLSQQAPDLIVLDEPTNNLDLQNIEILSEAINQYQGTLLVVSHDERFLEEINVEDEIDLGNYDMQNA
ncbi:MAG: ABC-F family ATP-binding cassette domain-containing protein [Bacteroidota bacterium]